MKKRIIVICPEPTTEIINTTLGGNGFTVQFAKNEQEAVYHFNDNRPDLILFDVNMEESEAINIFRNFNPENSIKHIPFIFLTSKPEELEKVINNVTIGPVDFIQKPINPILLKARVKAFFSISANLTAKYEEKMEKLRTDITFALPHEFRTALNGILGFSTQIYKITLEKTALKSKYVEEIHDMASLITASGRHLQRLTENFLLYSQLSTYQDKQDKIEDLQKLQLNNSKEIITELVLQVSKEFKREWDFDMKIGNYCLQISSYHFHKIIFELIDNALKFSSPGNIITIEDENNYGCYSLKVIDNGRGMTPEQIENIGAYCQFDRYVYEQQGTGMGLIIAKLLVILHSGKFNISSKINTGTEVSISLPLAQCKG